MCFVRSNSKTPPYHFEVVQGGHFSPTDRYGKIEVSHFSDLAILRFFKRLRGVPAPLACCSIVFQQHSEPNTHNVHIVVSKHLANYIKYLKENDYKDWTPLESQQVEFEDTGLIGVDLEQAVQSMKQWKIKVMKTPAKISRRAVKQYSSGLCVPHIPLRVWWESEPPDSPQGENLTLALTGTAEPVSFIVECFTGRQPTFSYSASVASDVFSPSRDSMGSLTSGSSRLSFPPEHTIFYKRVDIRLLSLIKYCDKDGEKELRISNEIKSRWRELAKQLGFDSPQIEVFAQSATSLDDMMSEWLRTDIENSWKKLIERMHDADLKTSALRLKHALSNIRDRL